jgi:hypothetical protein
MLQKQYAIEDIATLKARFAYMFAKPTISLEFYQGWFPIVVGLCTEIDRVLGEHRARFHWVQIKEKFGVMRLHFDLEGAPELLRKKLQELVSQAGRESTRCCMVCGEAGRVSQQSVWMVTVCAVHEPDEVSRRGGRPLHELMAVPEHPGSAS